jgi:hypothetical protein
MPASQSFRPKPNSYLEDQKLATWEAVNLLESLWGESYSSCEIMSCHHTRQALRTWQSHFNYLGD